MPHILELDRLMGLDHQLRNTAKLCLTMLLELDSVESSFELGSSTKQAMLEQIYKLDMFF